MVRFNYKKKHVGDISRKTDWRKVATTTWTETTYAQGSGHMCLTCYKKRQIRFWTIFGAVLLAAVIAIILGAVMPLKPLMYAGIAVIGVMLIPICSKSGAELYDLGNKLMCMSNAAQEFVSLLLREHSNVLHLSPGDKVEATKAD